MGKGVLETCGQHCLDEHEFLGLKEEKCLQWKFAGGDLGILPGLCQTLELTYSVSQMQPLAEGYRWQLLNANLSHSKTGEWLWEIPSI